MPDRLIRMRENNRAITRGIVSRGDGAFHLRAFDDGDILPITVDWSNWLGSDTIASVTNDATGATVTSPSNTTTTATFSMSGETGFVSHTIVTAAGARKTIIITLNGTDYPIDYPAWRHSA